MRSTLRAIRNHINYALDDLEDRDWSGIKHELTQLMIHLKRGLKMFEGPKKKSKREVPAEHFVATVGGNVDNEGLTDAEFRQFIRNTLPIVIYTGAPEGDDQEGEPS
jgi:hypothetical protein